jgi:uncharacterized protein YccT (UPF0319 family)
MLTRHVAFSVFLALGLLAGCASAPIQLHEQPGGEGETALIILPEQIEVATVNGLEISGASGLLRRGDTTLEVIPGRYELVAFYRELWEKGDHHDMLRSDPALFVVEAEAGHRYRLDYTRPTTLPEAEVLAQDFGGWVEDLETGARTPSQDSGLQFRRGLVPAATFDSTLVPSAGTGGARQSVAPLASPAASAPPPSAAVASAPQAASAAPVPPVDSRQPGAAAAGSPQAEDWLALMKTWWREASQDERREFLRWVSERP